MSTKTFEEWHRELTELASQHGISWLIPKIEDYPTDGYNEGLTPAEELSEQFSAAVD